MIPKIIHYCWLPGPEYPAEVGDCIATWRKYMSEYEIVQWDETSIDFDLCRYAKEALELKKYAFVSDYVRLRVLYEYGGVYLDSDVEVYKSFNNLIHCEGFTGFESSERIATWILASEPKNPIIGELLLQYEERRFRLPNGRFDTTPNPVPVTSALVRHGLKLGLKDAVQEIDHFTVYPMTFFCPQNPYRSEVDCFSEDTYTNHHFNGTWLHGTDKLKTETIRRLPKKMKKWLGK